MASTLTWLGASLAYVFLYQITRIAVQCLPKHISVSSHVCLRRITDSLHLFPLSDGGREAERNETFALPGRRRCVSVGAFAPPPLRYKVVSECIGGSRYFPRFSPCQWVVPPDMERQWSHLQNTCCCCFQIGRASCRERV